MRLVVLAEGQWCCPWECSYRPIRKYSIFVAYSSWASMYPQSNISFLERLPSSRCMNDQYSSVSDQAQRLSATYARVFLGVLSSQTGSRLQQQLHSDSLYWHPKNQDQLLTQSWVTSKGLPLPYHHHYSQSFCDLLISVVWRSYAI